MAAKRKTITIAATNAEYREVSEAARAARMSRSAWMLKAAEEKLARETPDSVGHGEAA